MLTHGDEVPRDTTLEADVAIAGAGPAGIALSRTLVDAGVRVLLLESGNTEFTRSVRRLPTALRHHLRGAQALARGESVGYPYFPLRLSRARAFGGSANALLGHGLRSHPLDALDFERREGLALDGWPFDASELAPYYERAQRFCGLGPERYDIEHWAEPGADPPLPPAGDVESTVYQFGPREAFTGRFAQFANEPSLQLVLDATVVDLAGAAAADRVDHLEVATLAGNRFRARARAYVLALGGIENPRALLLSRGVHPAGLGNAHDLVGRYFMEHLHFGAGFVRPHDPALAGRLSFYDRHLVRGTAVEGMVQLREEARRREGLLNASFHLRPTSAARLRPGVRAAGSIRRSLPRGPFTRRHARYARAAIAGFSDLARAAAAQLRRRSAAPDRIALGAMSEQLPDPESRVSLGTRRDRLGQPVARLDWRIGEEDRDSVRRTLAIMDRELQQGGVGAIELPFGDEKPPTLLRGGWHHMGTTRMHDDPAHGVVDAECRLHGTRNVYVAGSSVFPTGGSANPTLTVVALALRLADHLAGRAASLPIEGPMLGL